MSWILVALVVAADPAPMVGTLPAPSACVLAADLPTGSLIFSRGDCLAVKVFSGSPYTHVGAVVERGGAAMVYDSTGGVGVRRQPLADYLAAQKTATISLHRPERPFTESQRARFESHLESQLGRPYAIMHHLSGKRADGLHCAEYVTDALIAGELLEAEEPARVSPASLKEGIERAALYRHVATIELSPPARHAPADAGWCGRMWWETRECTSNCYAKMRGWFCCK